MVKRILVINSNAMFGNKEGLYIYKGTGEFLTQLSQIFKVESFHFKIPFITNDAMASFNLKETNIKITTTKKYKNKIFSYLIAYFVGLFRLLNNDFLYLFYPNSFYILGYLAVIFNKPFALYVRGEVGISSSTSIFLYKHAKFILTVSPKFTESVNKYNHFSETIKPMISFNSEDIVKNKIYYSKKIYNLLFVGRIEYDKGVYELVEAINLLILSGQRNFRITFVGDGDDSYNIKKMVQKYKLENYFEFKGSIYDKEILKKYYISSDIFILPSHHEGFPRVLYEAMIFGVPILTTFVGSISYIMRDQFNCYQLEVNNSIDIAKKISFLIGDYPIHSFVANNGTNTILSYLADNKESHFEKFVRLIRN